MNTPVLIAALSRHVEWVDTDAAGYQRDTTIMHFVGACEAQMFQDLELLDYFGQAPRVRHEVNYRAKLYFG